MSVRSLLVSAALACGGIAPIAAAQPIAPAAVTVRVGADLESEAARYGRSEFETLRRDLVASTAARAARGGFTRLDLVLDYARPNHPTINQLGLQPSLSFRSVGLGGATVTGVAYRADGAAAPLKFSWYETDLRQEFAAGVWTDADRAFDFLGLELARGRTPNRLGPGALGPHEPLRLDNVF